MFEEVIKIDNIEIAPIPPKNGLIAFVSFVINDSFFVGNVAVYTSPVSPDGFRLVYPTKMGVSCFHPVCRTAGEAIQKKVIGRYLEIIEKLRESEEDFDERSYK